MFRFRTLILSSASGLALCSAAAAQETIVLDPIFVTLVEDGQENVEATGGAEITEADIEALQPQNVTELFSRESSVTVAGGGGPARRIHVLGMEQSNLAVSIDGVPQVATSWHHTGSSVFDPAFLKSVEVEAGAAAADSGFAAAAGAVRYTTVSALDLLEPGRTVGGRARLSYGTNGRGVSGSLAGFGQYNGFDYLLMLSGQDGDDYESGDGTTILGTRPAASGALAKLGYQTDEHRIELTYQHDSDKADRTIKMNLGLASDTDLYPMDVTRDVVKLTYTSVAPTATWDPTVEIYYSNNAYWRPDYATGTRATNGDMDLDEDQLGGKIQNVFSLAMGSVTTGIDFNQHDYSVDAYGDNMDGVRSFSTSQIGAYMQARLELGRFDLSTGARFDAQRFDDWNGERHDDAGASYNATLSYAITDGLEVFAGASRTWLGYVIGDYAYLHARSGPAADGYYPVGDFGTGEAENFKVGFNYSNGAFNGGVTYFDTTVNGRPLYGSASLTNDAKMESKGITLNASRSYGAGRVGFTYTAVDTKYDGADSVPDGSSFMPVGDTASIYIDHTLPAYDLTVGATAKWAAGIAYDDPFVDQDSYTVVNTYASWTPPALRGATLRLGVDNLFDETYYERSSYAESSARGGIAPIYAPGRVISVSASMDF
ncbi:MAG: TonB-dependent receptor domain-containing protein [Arachnia sp.]